jgi:hypothetical protein
MQPGKGDSVELNDDKLMAEMQDLTLRFEKNTAEKEYALFVLPSLEVLAGITKAGEDIKVLDEVFQMVSALVSYDPDDPQAVMKLSRDMGITLWITDPDGNAVPKPDWMEDAQWKENVRGNARVFQADVANYFISTVFIGLRHATMADATLYEVGVFDRDTLELVEGMFHTNSKRAAYHCHCAYVEKWTQIVNERKGK